MINYRLSAAAAADIEEIFEYSIEIFGLYRATAYLSGLSDAIEMICEHPKIGQTANELSTGLRRLEYQSHVVFYQLNQGYIHIVRVLHNRMEVDDQVKGWLTKPVDSISERISAYG